MQFRARRLLKVVSLVLAALVFGLLAAIVILSIGSDTLTAEAVWILAPMTALPCAYVLKLIRDSFSVLEVDDQGVRVLKWLGGTRLSWPQIHELRYWEQLQMVHGATSREYFAELRSPEGKRLLRLKSTYEPAAFACLIEQARARNVKISLPSP
jgi:hypothetical protein